MEFIDNLEGFKNNGVVLTVGFFDGVHVGHRFLINQLAEIAKAEGLQSAVLTFWPHPRIVLNEDYKPKLLNSYEEKFELMKALPIDFCIRTEFSEAFSNYQAYDFMKLLKEKLNVKHLLVGYDHRFGKNREEGFDDYCVHGEALGIKVKKVSRRARFKSVITLIIDGKIQVFEGALEGVIAREKSGNGGFGYDPIFIADEYPGLTLADISEEEKNAISHRGKALRAMAAWLHENR